MKVAGGLKTYLWSPKLAYAVGLIVADGSLSKDGRHIDFTSKDKVLVELLQSCLSKQHCKIGMKHSGSSNNQYYRLQFSDRSLYDWLLTVGLTSNKSLTLPELLVPDEFFFEFLRGVFDGDGTIYATPDKRWKNAETIALGFASGSKPFLVWLQTTVNRDLGTTGFITNGARVLQLRYGKRDAILLYDALYSKKPAHYLPRKFAKMQKILRIVEPS